MESMGSPEIGQAYLNSYEDPDLVSFNDTMDAQEAQHKATDAFDNEI